MSIQNSCDNKIQTQKNITTPNHRYSISENIYNLLTNFVTFYKNKKSTEKNKKLICFYSIINILQYLNYNQE